VPAPSVAASGSVTNDHQCPQVIDDQEWWQTKRAAGEAKRRGVEIFVISFGRYADMALLSNVASGHDHVYESRGSWQLAEVYGRVAGAIKPTLLMPALTLTDEIPINMAYVEGSAVPAAGLQDRNLTWHLTDIPLGGTGVRYRLRPLEAGQWPTNVYAVGDYVDLAGEPGKVDFPVPTVLVLAPTPTAAPTGVPTATPTLTATSTATSTPTPTRTATPVPPRSVYLPLLLREQCDPTKRHVDVALVIDASTSMGEPTSAGRSKLAAAIAGAGQFMDALDLAHDQAAVVSFNATATTLQGLTSDRAALKAALAQIAMAQYTRLDLGIAYARQELASSHHRADSQAAMIVLTDGRANPVGPDAAVAEAAQAKAAGVIVFTIGLGNDLDLAALEAIASQPEYFYRTADAEDLAAIYGQIATLIPCPSSAFWGRRG
jgi:Mg-chelatase subunit ChlD